MYVKKLVLYKTVRNKHNKFYCIAQEYNNLSLFCDDKEKKKKMCQENFP